MTREEAQQSAQSAASASDSSIGMAEQYAATLRLWLGTLSSREIARGILNLRRKVDPAGDGWLVTAAGIALFRDELRRREPHGN